MWANIVCNTSLRTLFVLLCCLLSASGQSNDPVSGNSDSDGGSLHFSNALALVMAVDDRLLQLDGGRLRFQEGEEAWIQAVKCQFAGQALQSIRVAFNSPAVLSGWAAGNPCTSNWTGITCSTVNGAPRVTTL